MNGDVILRHGAAAAAKEIKASAHYSYIVNGITLDGTKFTVGELVVEGQCLVKDNTSGKYEKYADATGAFPAGKSNPVILDESVKFVPKDNGANPDLTAGQVLVHGSVYTSMLVSCTTAFKTAIGSRILFVE